MTTDAPMQPHRSALGTNKKRILAIAAVIVVLFVAVASVSWSSSRDRAPTRSHQYIVRIETNTTEEYVVRLPVPVDVSRRMPPYFVQDIEIHMGYPIFALGEYDYGIGLEVRASGYVEFEWSKVWPESWNEVYGNLTMTTGAEGWDDPGPARSWIFSDLSDMRIFLLHSSINRHMETPVFVSGGGPTFDFYTYPNGTGWQQVEMDYGWMVIN
jgi:hypothetical protein